ncbi:DUF6907 domain-containing protein [Streptomyces sp. NPDC056632]|uniref:DUF6907 domain-containing protein n=1 Tax=Streptomyces sp. NPDC056632 TaxID=3345884 RepID=UPI0036A3EBEF
MTRHVEVSTTDHGTVGFTCPPWCVGHTEHQPCFREDISHTGPEHAFAFEGSTLLVAMLTQSPYAADADLRRAGVHVEQTGYWATLDYAGLRQLAAALTVHAMHLRTLADELAAIRAGEAGE